MEGHAGCNLLGNLEGEEIVYRRSKDLIIFWAKRFKGYEGLPSGSLLQDWSMSIGVT